MGNTLKIIIALNLFILGLNSYAQNFNYKQNRFDLSYQRLGNSQTLKFKGSIILGSGETVQSLLRVIEKVPAGLDTRVVLDVFGGDIAVVNKVFHALRAKCHDRGYRSCEITTEVEMFRTCASACIPLFMIGDKRIAAERSNWGFHQASVLGGFVMLPFMSEFELRRKGVNRAWLKRHEAMFATLRVTWLEPLELNGSGIITHIIKHPK